MKRFRIIHAQTPTVKKIGLGFYYRLVDINKKQIGKKLWLSLNDLLSYKPDFEKRIKNHFNKIKRDYLKLEGCVK